MKDNQLKNKERMERLLASSLRIQASELRSAKGHMDKRKRRVAIWAYAKYLGYKLPMLQEEFGIASAQALRKMLRQKTLIEDEYNWRRQVMIQWQKIQSSEL